MNADRSREGVELPTLDPGVTLLDVDPDLGVEPLCALVLDRLLDASGRAFWVDAGGHVRTRTLLRLAPHPRHLDRLTVARGFTAHQHASLLDRLPRVVSDASLDGSPPAVVVVPAMDRPYREGDAPRERARDLLVRRLATLAGIARDREVPVVLTRARADGLSDPLAAAARETLACRATPFGPRFVPADGGGGAVDAGGGSDDGTLVYHLGDGWMQTTLAYWRQILDHRARVAGAPVAEPDATPTAGERGPSGGEPPSPTTPEGW